MKAQIKKLEDSILRQGYIDVTLTEIPNHEIVQGRMYFTFDEKTKELDFKKWEEYQSTIREKLANNSEAAIQFSNEAETAITAAILEHYATKQI